jgi:hypothetical protein
MPESAAALPLAELQSRMAAALFAADHDAQHLPEAWFAGALPGAEGLRVHRNTVLAALSNALRASYPSIDRLVGEAFFDRMAVDFARASPPAAPQLSAWGAHFAQFIGAFPGTGALPYLGDLARFDWQIDELGRVVPQAPEAMAERGIGHVAMMLAGGLQLRFIARPRLFEAQYPVDALRDAALADDAAALAAADGVVRPRHYALWRAVAGVKVSALSVPAARFIASALRGESSEQALAAAAEGFAEAEVAAILEREVLQAGFVRIEAPTHTDTRT